MKLTFSPEDERFRESIATWLAENLTGEFEHIRFRGGPGDEHMFFGGESMFFGENMFPG